MPAFPNVAVIGAEFVTAEDGDEEYPEADRDR